MATPPRAWKLRAAAAVLLFVLGAVARGDSAAPDGIPAARRPDGLLAVEDCAPSPEGAPIGCPCAARQGGDLECRAGLYCTSSFNRLFSRTLQIPGVLGTDRFCVSCVAGDYCPKGTDDTGVDAHGENYRYALAARLMCPEGSFCPDPAQIDMCPLGSFCNFGSNEPSTCNVSSIIISEPVRKLTTVESTTVVNQIFDGSLLVVGNFCPQGATSPNTVCPAGYYCPNAGRRIVCPAGSYCPRGSYEPLRLPWMSMSCGEGCASPPVSIGGIILGISIFVLITVTYLYFDKRKTRRAKAALGRSERKEELQKMLTSLGIRLPPFHQFTPIQDKVSIQFKELSLTIQSGAKVLDNVTGEFSDSELVAIMGGSGCGKSTFLNVLCGKATYGKMTGSVLINHQEAPLDLIRRMKGFVPQDDIVHETLTVKENLIYQALMRLPSTYTWQDCREMTRGCCELLQLEHVMNSVVGSVEQRGISGGQRKRVNIGLELVTKPSVLFLDEPTSGLDATSSFAILQGLKTLSSRGMSSIMVIHQPRYSIFKLFSKVMLMLKGGHLAYLGPADQALVYMQERGFSLPENENPADFFLDVLAGEGATGNQVKCHNLPDFNPLMFKTWWAEEGQEWLDRRARESRAPRRLSSDLKRSTTLHGSVIPRFREAMASAFADTAGENTVLKPADVVELFTEMNIECNEDDAKEILLLLGQYTDGEVDQETLLNWDAYSEEKLQNLVRTMSTRPRESHGATMEQRVSGAVIPEYSREGVMASSAGPEGHDAASPPQKVEEHVTVEALPGKLPQQRRSRSPLGQVPVIYIRTWQQWVRGLDSRVYDYGLVTVVAFLMGVLLGLLSPQDKNLQAIVNDIVLVQTALGVVCCISSLEVYGKNRVMHWREASTGFSVVAVFIGKGLWHLIDIILRPLLFTFIWWSLYLPKASMWGYIWINIMSSWWCASLGYAISTSISPANATIAGAAVPLILGGFLNGFIVSLPYWLLYFSWAWWSIGTSIIYELSTWPVNNRPQVSAFFVLYNICGEDFATQLEELERSVEQIEAIVSGCTSPLLDASRNITAGASIGETVSNALVLNETTYSNFVDGCTAIGEAAVFLLRDALTAVTGGIELPQNQQEALQGVYEYCTTGEGSSSGLRLVDIFCASTKNIYDILYLKQCSAQVVWNLAWLFLAGIILQVLAFLGLKFLNANKQV